MSEKKKEKRVIYPLRLSPSERKKLEELAEAVGLKLSSYLRQAGLNGGEVGSPKKMNPIVPEANRRTYWELGETNYQLRRIGININQIAKASNTALKRGYLLSVESEKLSQLSQQLEELEGHIEQLRASMIGVSN